MYVLQFAVSFIRIGYSVNGIAKLFVVGKRVCVEGVPMIVG